MTGQVQQGRYITYVPLESFLPAVRNPKEHDIPHLVGLIRRFGFTMPGLADERTQRAIAGHGRALALVTMYAGNEKVPDGILVDDDGGWLMPVIRGWASRNDAEAEAAIIADNQAQNLGGWHYKTLAAMVEDVTAYDGALFEELALSSADLDKMFAFTKDATDPDLPTPDPLDDLTGTDGAGDGTDLTTTPAPDATCPACGHTFTP